MQGLKQSQWTPRSVLECGRQGRLLLGDQWRTRVRGIRAHPPKSALGEPRLNVWFALVLLISNLGALSSPAADPAKPFYLPKSPTAAAYVLGRLSNQELIDAPRSEFVYVALLQRNGLDRKYRLEALDALAGLRQTNQLSVLLQGLTDLDRKGDSATPALSDLAVLLLQQKPDALSAGREDLRKLAAEAQTPLGRQAGFAGLITAAASPDEVWRETETTPARLADLLLSLALVRAPATRAAFYPKVLPLLRGETPAEVRLAAIQALPALPGHDPETFAALAELLKAGTELPAVAASLQKVPRAVWPEAQADPLATALLGHLQRMPADQRTSPDATALFQLGSDLAARLPPVRAAEINRLIRALGVNVIVLHTLKDQMLYDKSLIVAEAGKPVELVLINDDVMPHNLVVIAPGSLQEVGEAAEKMPTTADAEGRQYLPVSEKVLHATKLVEAGQQARLSFTAPAEPGDYQYVCTFPGHWRRMSGTLAVVKDVEAYLASHQNTAPKVTDWKLADLAPEMPRVDAVRNLGAGRELFAKLACKQCHKLGPEGYGYGPDLTEVFKRWKNDPTNVVEQILEPSKVIEDRYRPIRFFLKGGDDVTGFLLKEDADTVVIQAGPSDALIQTLKKSDLESREPQRNSVMPVGLLGTLAKDEILDLLAFLKYGGAAPAHEHGH